MILFLILGLLVGALAIIFTFQNIATITVVFLVWQFEGSLALIIVLAIVAGMIMGMFLLMPEALRKRFQISKLKDRNVELKDELTVTKAEVISEKGKVAANNAYLDNLEKNPKA
ncbi:MAG: hypothetical protein JWO73_151 [Candidatus Taylorbacteria bacterium]|nr:hypothetical protein [Candidatus Taylorbacteria bacterium]